MRMLARHQGCKRTGVLAVWYGSILILSYQVGLVPFHARWTASGIKLKRFASEAHAVTV